MIDRGEASTVEEPEDERDSEVDANGSANDGVSLICMAVTSRLLADLLRPFAAEELLGIPKPRPALISS